jgi:hypothetical protein
MKSDRKQKAKTVEDATSPSRSNLEVSDEKKRLIAEATKKLNNAWRLSDAEFEEYVETIRDQFLIQWYISALNGETKNTGSYQYCVEKAIYVLRQKYEIQKIKIENELFRSGNSSEMRIKFELPYPTQAEHKKDD